MLFSILALLNLSLAASLRPCTIAEIQNGTWRYAAPPNHLEQCSYEKCPKVGRSNLNHYKLHYMPGTFFAATYEDPTFCQLLDLSASVQILKKHDKKSSIAFVGDSVGMQTAITLRCFAEILGLHLNVESVRNITLRPEGLVLCNSKCNNISFANSSEGTNRCMFCPSNLLLSPKSDDGNLKLTKLHNIGVLVLNSGAWYTDYWGVENIMDKYIEMLHILAVDIHRLVTIEKKHVVWVSIPISVNDTSTPAYYGRGLAATKNEHAKAILAPAGAIIVDLYETILPRLNYDHNISVDGLHWRMPGPSSIPLFIVRVALHEVASQLEASVSTAKLTGTLLGGENPH